MIKCAYCLKGKEKSEFKTVEHIWSQALGIKNPPDLFMTDQVCDRCNHLSGLFVDGLFLKNYLVAADRSLCSHRFIDPNQPSASLPHYFGTDIDFPCPDGWQCDRYCGATGEHIYHVRPESDEIWWAYVGGDPKKQAKSKAGRVYIF